MSEEAPFKSMKVTLSEAAIDMLELIKKDGYFRSYSTAVEESIRTIFFLRLRLTWIKSQMAHGKPVHDKLKVQALNEIVIRATRFVPESEEQ